MRPLILALFYSLLATAAAAVGIPALIYAGAAMYDNAMRDDFYPHSGSCPECPTHEEGDYDYAF